VIGIVPTVDSITLPQGVTVSNVILKILLLHLKLEPMFLTHLLSLWVTGYVQTNLVAITTMLLVCSVRNVELISLEETKS
jgi:hypothetical protein